MTLGAFGGVAGVFAIFFFSDVPKVRQDILQVRSQQLANKGYQMADDWGRKCHSLATTS